MKNTLFKLAAGIVGIYHTLLGLAGLLLPIEMFLRLSSLVLGVSPEAGPQFEMIAKFTSAYLLAFGVVALLLCWKPERNKVLVVPVLILLGTRLINKIVFFGFIGETFAVSTPRGLFAVASLAILFLVIALTIPKEQQDGVTHR
ncbi:MAG: hypothetical protein HC904_12860 [Blastochloris sp.]|nr:hypothetical protein [Blastochloris sp.]